MSKLIQLPSGRWVSAGEIQSVSAVEGAVFAGVADYVQIHMKSGKHWICMAGNYAEAVKYRDEIAEKANAALKDL